jgi:heat shock protein HslJ
VKYRLPSSGSITNPWPGSEVTAAFDDAASMSGSTGCNEYSAAFDVSGAYDPFEEGVRDENDGQVVSISITAVTERACEEQNFMEQEGEFLENLSGVGNWLIARGNLLLRGEEAFLEFEPVS